MNRIILGIGVMVIVLAFIGIASEDAVVKDDRFASIEDTGRGGKASNGQFESDTRSNSWYIQTVDTQNSVGYDSSVAMDDKNRPHISYYDMTVDDLKYAWFDGDSWHVEIIDEQGDVGYGNDIAIDSNNSIHIGYVDYTNRDSKYAYFNGSAWTNQTVYSSGLIAAGKHISIAVDSNDRPHMCWYDQSGGNLRYAYHNGSQWTNEIAVSTDVIGLYCSIDIDSNDRPHISYYDDTNDDLQYSYKNATGWQTEKIDSTGRVGRFTSIEIDSSDRPHIGYYDSTLDDLNYAYFNGIQWQIETVDSQGNVGQYAELELNASENPHISYFDDTNDELKYCYHDGNQWHNETVDSNGMTGKHNSLIFTSNDVPHISYHTSTGLDLKYAVLDNDAPTSSVDALTGYWKHDSINITMTASDNGESGVDSVELFYRYREHEGLNWNGWNSSGVDNKGPWFWIFNFSQEGHYEFYSNATDRHGRVESSPGSADAKCGYRPNKWSILSPDTPDNVGQYSSLALDNNNLPHICYYDVTTDDLRYARFNGTQWLVGTADTPDDRGKFCSIAVGSDNKVHFAYYDDTENDLRYAKYYNGSWSRENIDSSDDVGKYTSIAVDSNNRPHISYYNTTFSSLQYIYHDGIKWNKETVDSTGIVGWYTSIALDSNDNPHISYYYSNGKDVKYAHKDGTWQIETVDSGGSVGYYTSLALDSNDKPHISYWDDTNDDLKYAHYDGNQWKMKVVDSQGDMGRYSSIAVDPLDRPIISYCDYTNKDLRYAYFDEGQWYCSTLDSTSSTGYYTSIAHDSDGRAHISYYYSSFGDLKYAVLDYKPPKSSVESISPYWSGSSPKTVSVKAADTSELLYFDNFESGWGNWTNVGGDDINWTRDSGGTLSDDTGPSSGADGTTWYVYTEATQNFSKIAIIESPSINFDLGCEEISFFYHMYGADMGYLYLETYTGGSWSTTWSLNGDQGNEWHFAVVDLSHLTGTGKLRFRGRTGSGFKSDITLDQISIYSGGSLAPVKDVTLWYRHSADNTSWSGWKYFGKDTTTPYSFNFGGPEGSAHYQFYSIANDSAGNTEKIPGSADAVWGYDKDAPTFTTPVIYGGSYYNNYFKGSIDLQAEVSDAMVGLDTSTGLVSINGGAYSSTGVTYSNGKLYYDNYSPGNNFKLKFRMSDVLNNQGTSSQGTFTYDNTAPTVGSPQLYAGNYDGSYFEGAVSLRAPVSDSGCGLDTSTYQVSINSGAWTSNGVSYSGGYVYYNNYSPGATFSILFRMKDNLGNQGTGNEITFSYDDTGPIFTNPDIYQGNSYNEYFDGTISIRASVSDGGVGLNTSSYQVNINSGGWSSTGVTYSGGYVYYNNYSPGASFTIKFRMSDKLGNQNSGNVVNYVFDDTAPIVGTPEIYQGIEKNGYFRGPIGIRVTSGDGGCGIDGNTAQYSLDNGGTWQNAVWDGTYIYQNGVTPGQNIEIKFRIKDELGNGYTVSSSVSYTYDSDEPTLGNPEIYQGKVHGQYYKGTIGIRATVTDAGCGVNGSTVKYSLDGGAAWQTADWDGTYAYKEGISPGAFITIQFKAKDELDNGAAFSSGGNYNFDNTKPSSSVDQLGDYWKINMPITIAATANDGGVGVMEVALLYQHSHDNSTWGNVTLYDIDTKSPWAFNFTFPADWGFYRFFSVANDSLGNRENIPGQFDKECGYDYNAPYIDADNSPAEGTTGDVHDFQITAMDNIKVTEVTATWWHGNNFGVDEKLDYLGGNNWSLKITLDHSLDNLNYSFRMMDPAGNEFQSQNMTINVLDNDEPIMDSDESHTQGFTGDDFEFHVEAMDNIGVSFVQINWSQGAHTGQRTHLNDNGDGSWSGIVVLDLFDSGELSYNIYIEDEAGNFNDSETKRIGVEDNDDPYMEGDDGDHQGYTGDNYTLRIRAWDNIGVKSVRVTWDHGMFQEEIELHPERNETMWTANIKLDPGSNDDLSYIVHIEDEKGNSNVTDPRYVMVMDNKVPIFMEELTTKEPKTGKQFNVSVRIEDNIGVESVRLGYVINEGQEPIWLHMEHVINEKYRATVEIPEDARFINYFFVANDTENNVMNTFNIFGTIQRHVYDTIPPVVGLHEEIVIDQHQPAHFEAWNASDNIGIENFTWSFFYDNQEIFLDEPEAEFTFGLVGNYVVTLTARDEAGNEGWNTLAVIVRDITPPVAKAGEDMEINQGDTLHLNGDGSHDNVGIVNYTWTFDYDGKAWSLFGVNFEFVFDVPGEYEIRLAVRDKAGNEGADNLTARVNDVSQPTASGTFNDKPIENEREYVVIQGTLCVLNAGNSTDNAGIESLTWTIEIEQERNEFHEMRTEYTFERIGTYRVSLTVRDPSGNEDHITFHVNVKPKDPESPTAMIVVSGDFVKKDDIFNIMKGTELNFNSGDSEDNIGIVARDWSVEGPGGREDFSGDDFDYTFNELGMYTVILNVYDEAGNSDSMSMNIQTMEEKPEKPTVGPLLDKDGKPVADAAVIIVYEGKEYTAKTDDSGIAQFDIPEIPEGTKITAEKDGEIIEWTQGGDQPAFKSQKDEGGLPTTLIIGAVAGLLLAIILILIIVRRRKKEDDEEKKKDLSKEKEEEEKKREEDEEEEEEPEDEAREAEAGKKKPPAKKAKTPAKKPKAVTAAPVKGRKGKPKKKPKVKPGRKKAAARIQEFEEELDDEEFEEDDEEFEEEYEVEGEEDLDEDVEEWDFEDITEEEMEELPLPPPPEDLKEHFSGLELERVSSAIKNIIPGYIITDKLGAGGFATVYKAINKDGVAVALKLPKFLDETIDSSVLNKFQAEADIWKKLIHKNIVSFLDSNIRPVPYMAIELMEGGNLAGLLKDHNLSPREAKPLMLQIVDGLSYAHRMASVHRDIKPENILFTKDGVPKIADWGIGKFMASESVSQSIGTKGTFAYAAPEQFDRETYGQVDWSTDIFQLGIVFYEMITGENPFMADELARVMGLILTRTPKKPSEINPEVPPELDEIVMKCLQKKKEDRWRSSDVLYTTLRDMEKRKLASLKKYRKTLERAMKDGHITEDEEEMLSEFREHFGITMHEHEELLSEFENG